MIYGIGTDICDVRRIEATLQRQGERFVRKVLSDAEFSIWRQRTARSAARGVRYLATRFSAKEAFSKAIGLGMRLPMTWRRCEIANEATGQPVVVLHGDLKNWFEAQGLSAHVSVTDESDYAASFVVVERAEREASVSSVSRPEPVVHQAAPERQQVASPEPTASARSPTSAPVPALSSGTVAQALPPQLPQPQAAPPSDGDRSILGRFGGQL